jgi:hypothetical protein
MTDSTLDADPGVNLVVLRGVVSAPAEERALRSGQRLLTFGLRVPGAGALATSVPVAVWDPPAWLVDVDEGDGLVLIGRCIRRFFQAAGATGSRVEVVATHVGRGTDRRRLAAVERRALDELAGLDPAA